jgi:D-alanyl-D-alanine carboxypeptidase (penicillin-binding protein 5/6)
MKKKILVMFMAFIVCFNTFAYGGEKKDYKAAVLIDYKTGRILYENKKDEILPQASITKLMTYFVIRENKIDMDEEIVLNCNLDKNEYIDGIGLKGNETIKLKDLIYTLLIVSANDSAMALQHYYEMKTGLSFIDEMNKKAKEIGMNKTKYINATGLTEGNTYNVTTAYDTAILAETLIKKYPDVLNITSQKTYKYNDTEYESTNGLLKINSNADGLKTGHTSAAGYCLVGTENISKNNVMPIRYISVVLGCSTEKSRETESNNILKYGEEIYKNKMYYKKGTAFNIKNKYYKGGVLEGKVTNDLSIPMMESDKIETAVIQNKKLPRKIMKDEKIGKVVIKNAVDGNQIEEDLYAVKDYKSVPFFKRIFYHISDFISSMMGKIAINDIKYKNYFAIIHENILT